MVHRRCTLLRKNSAKDGGKQPFGRLDEPAVDWKGDVASLEKHLLTSAERQRRKRDMDLILSKPEYMREAVNQLVLELERIKAWERQLDRFMHPQRLFIIERVLAQLEMLAQMTTEDAWPEFFRVIAEYRQLNMRTAGARFSAIRSVLEQTGA